MNTDDPKTSPVRASLPKFFLALLLLVLGLAVYLCSYGCPEWLADEIVRAVRLDGIAVEADRVRLHPIRGVVINNARLYRKRVVGPPALEAGQVTVALDLLALLKDGAPLVRRVAIQDGVFRPAFLHAPPGPGPSPPSPPSPLPKTRFYLALQNVRLGGLTIEQWRGDVVLDERAVRVRDIAASVAGSGKRGEIRRGEVVYHLDPDLTEGSMETHLDPRVLLPLLEEFRMPETAALVQDYEFGPEPPRCEVRFRNYTHPDLPLAVETKFWFQDGKYKGVDLLRADGTVLVDISKTNFTVAVKPLFVVRKEGTASAGFTVDANRRTVEFEGVSTIHPLALTRMIGILTNGVLDDFRFDGQVTVAGQGIANYGDQTRTRLDLRMAGRNLGWSRLNVEEYSMDINVVGLTNALNNIRARFYGGDLTGRTEFVLAPDLEGDTRFAVSARLNHANFERFMRDVEKDGQQEYAGRLSCILDVGGLFGEANLDTIKGEGSLRVKEGKILLLPVFGGLTKILTDYIPGLDFAVNQTDVKSDFKIAKKKISTDQVYIEGSVIRLDGRGDYRFDNALDFRVQVKLLRHQSILSYLTDPVMWIFSKLFEFRLSGDVSDPKWTAFSSTVDLLEKIGLKSKKDKDKKGKGEKEKPGRAPPPEETEPPPPDEE